MAKYVLKYSELVELEQTQLNSELERLEQWLHETGIDPDFDHNDHIYVDGETGDRWLFLPELNSGQLFAMELIVSSTEVTQDGQPLRRGPSAVPNTSEDEVDNQY